MTLRRCCKTKGTRGRLLAGVLVCHWLVLITSWFCFIFRLFKCPEVRDVAQELWLLKEATLDIASRSHVNTESSVAGGSCSADPGHGKETGPTPTCLPSPSGRSIGCGPGTEAGSAL